MSTSLFTALRAVRRRAFKASALQGSLLLKKAACACARPSIAASSALSRKWYHVRVGLTVSVSTESAALAKAFASAEYFWLASAMEPGGVDSARLSLYDDNTRARNSAATAGVWRARRLMMLRCGAA